MCAVYSETLLHPHPRRVQGDTVQQPLHDELQLNRVAEELELLATIDEEAHGIAKQEIVDTIAHTVNKSLWFPVYGGETDEYLPDPLPLDTIASRQITNCFGYTLVASECLEEAAIDHWIGYANGHAFLLVPFGKQTYFMDALSPQMNGFIDNALERGSNVTMADETQNHGRGVVMLNTQVMAANLGINPDSTAEKYPWFTMKQTPNSVGMSEELKAVAKYASKYRLVMSVFEQHTGRSSIEEYVSYELAMSVGDIDTAHDAIMNMSGRFPNLDARQDHHELRNLVRKLCVRDPEAAAAVTERYFSTNFRNLRDSRIHEAKGDIFRTIARMAGFRNAAEQAADAYQEAARMPHAFKAAVLGKLSVAQSLVGELPRL